jgi:hypothetical protein
MMSIAEIASWLEQSSLGVSIAESEWMFPTIETVHVIAVALVVGSIVVLDLRLLGLAWGKRTVTEVAEDVLPLTWVCFVIAVVAGALMFVSAAQKYVSDLPFRLKMILLALAGANMAIFHIFTYTRVHVWGDRTITPRSARIAAALSLLFWISIVGCGRLVGFTTANAPVSASQSSSLRIESNASGN